MTTSRDPNITNDISGLTGTTKVSQVPPVGLGAIIYSNVQLICIMRTKLNLRISTTSAPNMQMSRSFIHRRPIGTQTSSAVGPSASGEKWRNNCPFSLRTDLITREQATTTSEQTTKFKFSSSRHQEK